MNEGIVYPLSSSWLDDKASFLWRISFLVFCPSQHPYPSLYITTPLYCIVLTYLYHYHAIILHPRLYYLLHWLLRHKSEIQHFRPSFILFFALTPCIYCHHWKTCLWPIFHCSKGVFRCTISRSKFLFSLALFIVWAIKYNPLYHNSR